jgi:hypothetical protein
MRPKSAELRPEKGRFEAAVPIGWEDSLAADRRRPSARWSEVSPGSGAVSSDDVADFRILPGYSAAASNDWQREARQDLGKRASA